MPASACQFSPAHPQLFRCAGRPAAADPGKFSYALFDFSEVARVQVGARGEDKSDRLELAVELQPEGDAPRIKLAARYSPETCH
jgi:hypothetical protein